MKGMQPGCVIVLLLSLVAVGCAAIDPPLPATSSITRGAGPYSRGDLGSLTYRAVDHLLAEAPEIAVGTPLVVGTIAEVQNVETTTALGNIVADMIRTRLSQDGHTVSELRLRRAVSFRKGEGEFMLSRTPGALMRPPLAAAMVTGTYAASYDLVYVSLKLVSATDERIVAGADFAVPLREVEGLLQKRTTWLPE
jgi:flagellar FlgO protein